MDFGEILEPSSRAFWDGFDELEENIGAPIKLEWIWMTSPFEALNDEDLHLVLIIEGSDVLNFVKTVLLKGTQMICKLENAKLTVYYCERTKNIFCISEENNLNVSSSITELLSSWLKAAKKVITISVLPKTSYKNDSLSECGGIAFIKGINSQYAYAPELEPPNFITGVSAGAACWRYLNNREVSCYVVYIDSEKLDVLSAQPVVNLIKDIGLKCDDKYCPKLKDESYLYM